VFSVDVAHHSNCNLIFFSRLAVWRHIISVTSADLTSNLNNAHCHCPLVWTQTAASPWPPRRAEVAVLSLPRRRGGAPVTASAIQAVLLLRVLAWNSRCQSVGLRSPLQFQILYINQSAVLVLLTFLLDIMTMLER
jgi:hypothetical protein